jgi:hypothetical protein
MDGAFEREVRSMLIRANFWIRSHERFTWINLLLSITPSPFTALAAIALAVMQLLLVNRRKIPSSEKPLLVTALIIGCINFMVSSLCVYLMAYNTFSIWEIFSPLWLIDLVREWLTSGSRTFRYI